MNLQINDGFYKVTGLTEATENKPGVKFKEHCFKYLKY